MTMPWRRALLEGFVIVASILTAFALEAWWDERGEVRTRDAILAGLASDFEAAEADLDRVTALHETSLAAAERLIALADAGTVGADRASTVDTLMSAVLRSPTFDPPAGTLEALLATGTLDMLDNPDLAAELTRWPAVVEEFREDEMAAQTVVMRDAIPYLRARGVLTGHLVLGYDFEPPWDVRPTPSHRLLADPELHGIVTEIWIQNRGAATNAETTAAALQRIQGLLGQE
jgi:hypothetical protein